MLAKIIKGIFGWWKNIDGMIILSLLLLAIYGIIMVYSATNADADYLERKILQVVLGIIICIVVANIKYTIVESLALPLLLVTIALLAITLVFGVTSKGATRWLEISFIRFQPSEFAKITVPLYLCVYFGNRETKINNFHFIVSFVLVAIPTLLIVLEPDLGTGVLVVLAGIIVIFLAGLPWKFIFAGATATLLAVPLFWEYGMRDYQKERILTILNPNADPLGAGYHVNQSKIAIGSGGIFGKGLFEGTQVQLNFLPESHTDFIFSVLGEELGLVGVSVLFVLYIVLILRLFILATKATHQTTRLLSSSLGFVLSIYIIVNVGMVSGLLPVVGVPLPLISYGGTSFISLCVLFGVIMGSYQQVRQQEKIFQRQQQAGVGIRC